jgi:hypothetical protein
VTCDRLVVSPVSSTNKTEILLKVEINKRNARSKFSKRPKQPVLHGSPVKFKFSRIKDLIDSEESD